jgi:hypothetical protein
MINKKREIFRVNLITPLSRKESQTIKTLWLLLKKNIK